MVIAALRKRPLLFRLIGAIVCSTIILWWISPESDYVGSKTNAALVVDLEKLRSLQEDNIGLLKKLQEKAPRIAGNIGISSQILGEPPVDGKIQSNIEDLAGFLRSQVDRILDASDPKDKNGIALNMQAFSDDLILKTLGRIDTLQSTNDYVKERIKATSALAEEIIGINQFPKSCKNAKKLSCTLNKPCGLGCQVHHVVYCLSVSLALNRTMILYSRDWRHLPEGWETFFLPVTSCALDEMGTPWVLSNNETRIVNLPPSDGLRVTPKYMPLAVPNKILKSLNGTLSMPYVWWIGKLAEFSMRPNKYLQTLYRKARLSSGLPTDYMAMHIRRTDKIGTEAQFHNAFEYYTELRRSYTKLSGGMNFSRKVFVATDDPNVVKELKTDFKDFLFVGNSEGVDLAKVSKREQKESVVESLKDLHLLSHSKHIVCTLSSHFCRLAFELMLALCPTDCSHSVTSLDDMFYFGGMQPHFFKVITEHRGKGVNELSLDVNDVIKVSGNLWNGYGHGTNMRTGRTGLFPLYKTIDVIQSY